MFFETKRFGFWPSSNADRMTLEETESGVRMLKSGVASGSSFFKAERLDLRRQKRFSRHKTFWFVLLWIVVCTLKPNFRYPDKRVYIQSLPNMVTSPLPFGRGRWRCVGWERMFHQHWGGGFRKWVQILLFLNAAESNCRHRLDLEGTEFSQQIC